jgi:hypothetical protein
MAKGTQWSLNDDRTLIRVDFPSEPPVRLEYDAGQLDDLIAALAELRGAMEPPVPMSDPDPGTRVHPATRGRFYVQPRKTENDLILALLHPGLRWIAFLFGREQALHLIDALRKHLPDPAEQK